MRSERTAGERNVGIGFEEMLERKKVEFGGIDSEKRDYFECFWIAKTERKRASHADVCSEKVCGVRAVINIYAPGLTNLWG
jgi:hypothetical protein